MNLKSWSAADVSSLRAFYDAGPGIPFASIDAGGDATTLALRNWIEAAPPPRRHPLLLPVVTPGNPDARWYAVAFSDAQAEALRAELNAFLGPVGSDFTGQRAVSDPQDQVDGAAFRWAGGSFIYRFDVLAGARAPVRAALERLQQVWRLRPARPSFVFRTTAALLREFFTALGNNDVVASQRWLTEINQSGRLSAENLKFLEIERLGAHGQWDQLALHPQLPLLTAIRRPRRITGLLVEALWRAELAKYFSAKQPAEAVSYMRSSFLARHEGLLRSRSGLTQPSAVLTFLLAAAAATPPRAAQVPVLVGLTPPGTAERTFAEGVAALVPTVAEAKPAVDPVARVRSLLASHDYDSAWMMIQGLPNGLDVCALMLDCAGEIYSEETARIALARLDELPDAVRKEVLRSGRLVRLRDELVRLVAAAGVPAICSWESWLEVIAKDPDWPQVVSAAQSSSDWDLEPYRGDPARVRRLAEQLQKLSTAAWQNARYATPDLGRFFMPDGVALAAFAPLYQSLLLALALDDQFGSEDWALTQTLATGILDAGVDGKGYEELVNALELIWSSRGETTRLDWALDLLDTLIDSPAPVPAARERFFAAVCSTFRTHPRRVNSEHRALFRLLCVDLQKTADFDALPVLPATEETSAKVGERKIAEGKVIGIYTLTVSAAARAKSLLEAQFAGIDVRLNHDHVGSARLESLAREADYLLVVAKSAKHAATDFIKQKRPRTKPEVIYPSGRGASSIVSALLQAVGTLA